MVASREIAAIFNRPTQADWPLFTARVLPRGEKSGFGSDPIANDGRTLPVVDKALFWDAIALSLSRGADFLPTDPRRTT
jgi:hypothetical protein